MTNESLSGHRVLVTGGAGFIGSHLVDALVTDNEVRVLDDLSTGHREYVNDDADLIVGDIRERDVVRQAMKCVDIVFHHAAIVDVGQSVADPTMSHSVNVQGTLNVLEVAREVDARVVVASSAAIYGDPEYVPIDEDHPKHPTSPYGLEKLATDEYARLYHELYGLETVALRYFNVYGPRQTGDYAGVVNVFLDQAKNGDPITINGDGSQTRDFVHVSDVVKANVLAARGDTLGGAFNIASGSSVSILDLAETIRSAAGSNSAIVFQDPRPGDIEKSVAETARAHSALEFESAINLEDGLGKLIRKYPDKSL